VTAALAALIRDVRYKPGWSFHLRYGATSASGACAQALAGTGIAVEAGVTYTWPAQVVTLLVCAYVEDSAGGGRIMVEHPFTVPAECADWERWLLGRILDVERHEVMEAFQVGGTRPFYPEHGPGARLYEIIRKPAGLSTGAVHSCAGSSRIVHSADVSRRAGAYGRWCAGPGFPVPKCRARPGCAVTKPRPACGLAPAVCQVPRPGSRTPRLRSRTVVTR
jgi:hypothetical protein